MKRTRRRHRRTFGTPFWAPKPIDAKISEVKPISGWIMLSEKFDQDKVASRSGIELAIVSPNTRNTVYGTVISLNSEDEKEMEIFPGDVVIYEAWQGGRWRLEDGIVLLTNIEHILAKVE